MIGGDFKKINKSQPLRPLTTSLTLSLIRNVWLISAYHCCWIKDVIVCWCQTQRKWPRPVCVSHWQTVPHTGGQGQPRGTDRSSDLPVCVCACVRRMRGEMRPILSAIARCKTACLQWHKVSLHTSSPYNSPFKCTNSVKLTLINIAISVSHNSSASCSLFSLRKCLTFGRTKEETESEVGEGYHPSFCVPYRHKKPLRSISVP